MTKTQQSIRLGDTHISLDTILMRMRQLNAAESIKQ